MFHFTPSSGAASSDDSVVLAVMTNPEPDDVRTDLDGYRAMMNADAEPMTFCPFS
jgi:hypothetical protein